MNRDQARDVLAVAFDDKLSPDARMALRAFARQLGVRTTLDALVRWFSMPPADARALGCTYLKGTRSARHPAALGCVVRAARCLGLIGWTLPTERRTAVPDVTCEPDNARDRAILALLREGITQRSLVGMDVSDVAPDGPAPCVRVRVRGAREVREITPTTADALRAWLADRGVDGGLLFVGRDPAASWRTGAPAQPMRTRSIRRILGRYASAG